MSMKTQGTQLYAIDPADDSVLSVTAVTTIDGIDSPVDSIETTPLEALTREFESGLKSPGAATFGINVDTRTKSHLRLHRLKTAGTTLQWAIGFSDGLDTAPTAIADQGIGTIIIEEGGSGYTTAPTVTFVGGGGSGATATATVADGKVTGFEMTEAGSGYTSNPTVILTSEAGSGAIAKAIPSLVLPANRTWIAFRGFMTAYPFSFNQNDVVKSIIGIQVSGDPILVPAAVTP